jgi:hypothetical protein
MDMAQIEANREPLQLVRQEREHLYQNVLDARR